MADEEVKSLAQEAEKFTPPEPQGGARRSGVAETSKQPDLTIAPKIEDMKPAPDVSQPSSNSLPKKSSNGLLIILVVVVLFAAVIYWYMTK